MKIAFRAKLEVVLLVTPSFEMFVKPGVCSTLRAFAGEVNSDIEIALVPIWLDHVMHRVRFL
jgi:hypothetical protein